MVLKRTKKLLKQLYLLKYSKQMNLTNNIPSTTTNNPSLPLNINFNLLSLNPEAKPTGGNQKKKLSSSLPIITSLNIFQHKSNSLTLEDAQLVVNQLGFIPLNLIEIGSRNVLNNNPLTVILYPLNHTDGPKGRYRNSTRQPFPTIFWMCCPDLKAKISRLEHLGVGNLIQEILDTNSFEKNLISESTSQLQEYHTYLVNYNQRKEKINDKTFHEQMREAHHEYSCERWYNITSEDYDYIRLNDWERALNLRVGIAGMKKFTQVKCLHTNYAHFISRPHHGNIIGEWVHEIMVREGTIPQNYYYTTNQSREISYKDFHNLQLNSNHNNNNNSNDNNNNNTNSDDINNSEDSSDDENESNENSENK